MDCSSPGPTVHEILQARILECVAISSSRGSSQGSNPGLLHCRQILYWLSYKGNPIKTHLLSVRYIFPAPVSVAKVEALNWWHPNCMAATQQRKGDLGALEEREAIGFCFSAVIPVCVDCILSRGCTSLMGVKTGAWGPKWWSERAVIQVSQRDAPVPALKAGGRDMSYGVCRDSRIWKSKGTDPPLQLQNCNIINVCCLKPLSSCSFVPASVENGYTQISLLFTEKNRMIHVTGLL